MPRDVRLSVDAGNPVEGLDVAGVALYAPTEAGLERDFGTAGGGARRGRRARRRHARRAGLHGLRPRRRVVEAAATPIGDPVSTLGAGDVFHGALLAALVRALPLADALAFANRAAALSCRALDGRSAIPTLEEVA